MLNPRPINAVMSKVTELFHEFQDVFPTKFSKMKGILDDLGEMRIPLKPDAKPVRQRPYWLKLGHKEKVKAELDRMLDAGIIEPVKELEWISPMVVQDKKTGEVRICVDFRTWDDSARIDQAIAEAYQHVPEPAKEVDVLHRVQRLGAAIVQLK